MEKSYRRNFPLISVLRFTELVFDPFSKNTEKLYFNQIHVGGCLCVCQGNVKKSNLNDCK